MLNHCLNDAMVSSRRIRGIPNSNKIAEFVNKWVKEQKLNE